MREKLWNAKSTEEQSDDVYDDYFESKSEG